MGEHSSPTNHDNGRFVGGNDLLNTRPEDIPKAIEIYHSYGQSTEMHLNGNASGEAWISGLEKIIAKDKYANIKDTRHTVIHAQFLERQQIQRQMARYDQLSNKAENDKMYVELDGTMKSGVPTMDFLNGEPGYTHRHQCPCGPDEEAATSSTLISRPIPASMATVTTKILFGPGRANQISPAKYSADYGQKLSFHNDTMVTPISPLQSIASGCEPA